MDCKLKSEVDGMLDNTLEGVKQQELEQIEDFNPECKIEYLENNEIYIKSEIFEPSDSEPDENVEADCDIDLGEYEVLSDKKIKVEEDEICGTTEPCSSITGTCVLCKAVCDVPESMVCISCQVNCEKQESKEITTHYSDEDNRDSSCCEDDNSKRKHGGKSREQEDPLLLVDFLSSQNQLLTSQFGLVEDGNVQAPSRFGDDNELINSGQTREQEDPLLLVDFLNSQNKLLKRQFGLVEGEANQKLSKCDAEVSRELLQNTDGVRKKKRRSKELQFLTTIIDGSKKYSCTSCSFKSTNISIMETHLYKSHAIVNNPCKPYKCNQCSFRCVNASALRRHVQSRHVKVKTFKCVLCAFNCDEASQLNDHMTTHANSSSSKNAASCGVRMKDGHKRKEEMKTMENGIEVEELKFLATLLDNFNSYCCRDCPYRTTNRKAMSNHLYAHTAKTVYKCTFCPYISGSNSMIKTHIAYHNRKKSYECRVCSFTCSEDSRLREHMTTHDNSRGSKQTANCEKKNNEVGESSEFESRCSSKEAENCEQENSEVSQTSVLESCDISSSSKQAANCEQKKNLMSQINEFKRYDTTTHGNLSSPKQADNCKQKNSEVSQSSEFTSYDVISYDNLGSPEQAETSKQNNSEVSQSIEFETHDITTHVNSSSSNAANFKQENNIKVPDKQTNQVLVKVIDGHKTYCCQFCLYKTRYLTHIKDHMHTHTGCKPFKCTLCSFSTSRKYTLKNHTLTHVGGSFCSFSRSNHSRNIDKPVKSCNDVVRVTFDGQNTIRCKICPFKTSNCSDMLKHSYTHKGHKL